MKDPRIGKLYIYHGAFPGAPSISIITSSTKSDRYYLYRLTEPKDPINTVFISQFTRENATEIHYEPVPYFYTKR